MERIGPEGDQGRRWQSRRRRNITAVLCDPPKRVGITEFPSVEKAKAWINSSERKAMQPQRDKAVKFVRQYIVEAQ